MCFVGRGFSHDIKAIVVFLSARALYPREVVIVREAR